MHKNELPSISIIIPTYNSEKVIGMCVKAAMAQNYPKDKFEVLVADNQSQDKTREIAESLGARVLIKDGKPSQACAQRNLGAQYSKKDFVFFLDHDMEMSKNLLKNFADKLKATPDIDAWYIREKIYACNKLLTNIRTYERGCYDGTVVDAARIIRRNVFLQTPDKYDLKLQRGPADWDLDVQLIEMGKKFGLIDECVFHHEEGMSFWTYIKKKGSYVEGGVVYQDKWQKRNRDLYNKIIKKQFSLFYRLFSVFFENGKWRKTFKYFYLYFCLLFIRVLVGGTYFMKTLIYRRKERVNA